MTATLRPLHELLGVMADQLEQHVRPHVAGEPFNELVDVIDQLANLAALRVIDTDEDVRPGGDPLPDYCDAHECQNVAREQWGDRRLCTGCYLELHRAVDLLTGRKPA